MCSHKWRRLEKIGEEKGLITASVQHSAQFCIRCYEIREVKWVYSLFGTFCYTKDGSDE